MPAPKNPNTRAATAKRVRVGQENAAAKLRAAGWATMPPEADPIPTEPGVYLSDTIYTDPMFAQIGDTALVLWHRCLFSPARIIVDGKAAIPVNALDRHADKAAVLVHAGLWNYHAASDTYVYERPGQVYAIVGAESTVDSRTDR